MDALLDGILTKQFVHKDRLVLADAIGAIGRLRLGRGIPPRIVMDHRVGRCEVEPRAAGFERDEKQRNFSALEILDQFPPILRRAGELEIGNIFAKQVCLDQCQHASELREYQNSPTFLDQHRQQLGEKIELRRFVNRVGKLIRQKPRIAANLAQLEQGIEKDDLEVAAATRGDRFTHTLVHRRAHGFVKVLLCGVQFNEMHQFGLGRQLLRDLILRAAQNERRDALFEHLVALNIAILLDRLAKASVESLLRAEKSGHQKFHQAPQLAKVILDRCA